MLEDRSTHATLRDTADGRAVVTRLKKLIETYGDTAARPTGFPSKSWYSLVELRVHVLNVTRQWAS